MRWWWITLVVVVTLFLLDRLARWLEDRGHLYYRKRSGRPGVGNALLEVHALLEPERRHVIEERLADREQAEDSGDPPPPSAEGREAQ